MQEFKRILVLENAIEAQLLDSVLTEKGIPHVMVSCRDSAYDGIYQLRRGWGHVEAPERYREDIAAIRRDLSQAQPTSTDEAEKI